MEAICAISPFGQPVFRGFGLCANTGIRRIVVAKRRISPDAIIT
jgi:hypothetical protein